MQRNAEPCIDLMEITNNAHRRINFCRSAHLYTMVLAEFQRSASTPQITADKRFGLGLGLGLVFGNL